VLTALAHIAEPLVGELGTRGQMTQQSAENLDDCGIVAGRVVNSEPNSGFLPTNGAAPLAWAKRGGLGVRAVAESVADRKSAAWPKRCGRSRVFAPRSTPPHAFGTPKAAN